MAESADRRPESPPIDPQAPPVAVAETHISTLFFTGDRAYKLKKAVDLGFIDQTTRERRLEACHREVELNRRLAPDVYLGVADVIGPDGELCDHLVVMRRLDPSTRLSALATAGADLDEPLRSVARQLAALHAASPPADGWTHVATGEARRTLWQDAIDVVRAHPCGLESGVIDDIADLVDRHIRGRGPLWDDRIASGRVVCGHGDLRAEDIFWDGQRAQILDCIDFDDELLWGDGLLDAAFLAMDLIDLGRPHAAERFLELYAEMTGDSWEPSLAHHLIAYRALVRAKVSALRVEQGDPSAREAVSRMTSLCHRALLRGRVHLVVVGGLPGSGKTTLATALAAELGAVVISSDQVRDEVDPRAHPPDAPDAPGAGRYRPERRAAVYDELLARASALLERGASVVVDASWSEAERRRAARRVASVTVSDLSEIRCVVPDPVREARIALRASAPRPENGASEATIEAARHLAAEADPWPEAMEVATEGDVTLVASELAVRLSLG